MSETAPPISGLVGAAGADLLRRHPGTPVHISYSLGVLASGQPVPPREQWSPRAELKIAEVTDPGEDGQYIALHEFGQMTIGIAYDKHDDYIAARTDSFGIPNRLAVLEDIEYALKWVTEKPRKANTLPDGTKLEAENERGLGMGILDIDYFKDVNDVLGHQFGDRVIRRICKRLNETMRQDRFDKPKDDGSGGVSTSQDVDWGFVGRMGGDEFAYLLRMHGQRGKAPRGRRGKVTQTLQRVFEGASSRIEAALAEEMVEINAMVQAEWERRNAARSDTDKLREIPPLRASFGWHLAEKGESETQLVAHADEAMYIQKLAGKAMDAQADRNKLNEAELEQVERLIGLIESKELVRYYRLLEPLRALAGLSSAALQE